MKTALITTTIRVPKVLELYRSFNKDVMFFVAGDRKTPHTEVKGFVEGLGNAVYYSDTDQEKLGYESSEIIGWNKIMRRNIALLEAIKNKADIIVTIDDDNIPLDKEYFNDFISLLSKPFSGLEIVSEKKWVNVGDFTIPRVFHRGFPYQLRHEKNKYNISSVSEKKIGICAGLWLGDPDIDAVERLVNKPEVMGFLEELKKGFVAAKDNFYPIDSQNTAYLREIASLMMVLVGVGRYDDIWASYIAERILMSTDLYCHYGKPFVKQERNSQNIIKNLKDEIFGMEFTTQFCQDLLQIDIGQGSVMEKLERLYGGLEGKTYIPSVVFELGKAWCKDVKKIIK